MDKNDSNKKPKLKQIVTESNVEHKTVSWEGIDKAMVTLDHVATINVKGETSNASKVDIPKSGEREICACAKQT